jgi:hypothetical protein
MAEHPLKRFSDRACLDSFFLGAALTAFRIAREWDENQLAEFLACDSIDLYRIASCRAPSVDPLTFEEEVRAIAAFSDCDPDRLAEIVREHTISNVLRGSPSNESNPFLLAARDRKPNPTRKPKKHGPGRDRQ